MQNGVLVRSGDSPGPEMRPILYSLVDGRPEGSHLLDGVYWTAILRCQLHFLTSADSMSFAIRYGQQPHGKCNVLRCCKRHVCVDSFLVRTLIVCVWQNMDEVGGIVGHRCTLTLRSPLLETPDHYRELSANVWKEF